MRSSRGSANGASSTGPTRLRTVRVRSTMAMEDAVCTSRIRISISSRSLRALMGAVVHLQESARSGRGPPGSRRACRLGLVRMLPALNPCGVTSPDFCFVSSGPPSARTTNSRRRWSTGAKPMTGRSAPAVCHTAPGSRPTRRRARPCASNAGARRAAPNMPPTPALVVTRGRTERLFSTRPRAPSAERGRRERGVVDGRVQNHTDT
jgi:hypothetical protein